MYPHDPPWQATGDHVKVLGPVEGNVVPHLLVLGSVVGISKSQLGYQVGEIEPGCLSLTSRIILMHSTFDILILLPHNAC
jgi:hypothetical protein